MTPLLGSPHLLSRWDPSEGSTGCHAFLVTYASARRASSPTPKTRVVTKSHAAIHRRNIPFSRHEQSEVLTFSSRAQPRPVLGRERKRCRELYPAFSSASTGDPGAGVAGPAPSRCGQPSVWAVESILCRPEISRDSRQPVASEGAAASDPQGSAPTVKVGDQHSLLGTLLGPWDGTCPRFSVHSGTDGLRKATASAVARDTTRPEPGVGLAGLPLSRTHRPWPTGAPRGSRDKPFNRHWRRGPREAAEMPSPSGAAGGRTTRHPSAPRSQPGWGQAHTRRARAESIPLRQGTQHSNRQDPGRPPAPGAALQGRLTSALKARVRLGWCCPELSCAGSPGGTDLRSQGLEPTTHQSSLQAKSQGLCRPRSPASILGYPLGL